MISKQERVLHVLIRLGGVATGREISKLLGWPETPGSQRVGHLMQSLIENNQVQRLGTGVYRIKGMEVLIHEARSYSRSTNP